MTTLSYQAAASWPQAPLAEFSEFSQNSQNSPESDRILQNSVRILRICRILQNFSDSAEFKNLEILGIFLSEFCETMIFPHILPGFPHIFSLFPHMGAGF